MSSEVPKEVRNRRTSPDIPTNLDCRTWLPTSGEEILESLWCDSVERPLWAGSYVDCCKLSFAYEAPDLLRSDTESLADLVRCQKLLVLWSGVSMFVGAWHLSSFPSQARSRQRRPAGSNQRAHAGDGWDTEGTSVWKCQSAVACLAGRWQSGRQRNATSSASS